MLVHFRYNSHVVPLYYRGSGRGVLRRCFIEYLQLSSVLYKSGCSCLCTFATIPMLYPSTIEAVGEVF